MAGAKNKPFMFPEPLHYEGRGLPPGVTLVAFGYHPDGLGLKVQLEIAKGDVVYPKDLMITSGDEIDAFIERATELGILPRQPAPPRKKKSAPGAEVLTLVISFNWVFSQLRAQVRKKIRELDTEDALRELEKAEAKLKVGQKEIVHTVAEKLADGRFIEQVTGRKFVIYTPADPAAGEKEK